MKPIGREPYDQAALDVADARFRKQCHPKQREFVFDPSSRVSACLGRGGGKTSAMLMRLLRRMMRRVDANCLFMAATRESAERLIWRDLKRICEKIRLSASFNESTLTCTLHNGARLMLFGCDDKKDINKLRGITYHEVGIDEVASISAELLRELMVEIIGPRMVGSLCMVGTPGKILEGRFYEATRPGGDENRHWNDRHLPEYANWNKWSLHTWNVQDGADYGIEAMAEFLAVAQEEKRREGWSDTNPYWQREYLGQWISDSSSNVYVYRPHDDDGNEWNQWDPKKDANGFAILPSEFKDWGYGIGIDVGFKDAFALEVFAFSYSDPRRTLYHVYEVYRTKLYAQAIAKLIIGEDLSHDRYGGIVGAIGWPDVMVGDFAMAGGALLAELSQVYGVTIVPADKPYKYKDNSIELMNSDFYDGRIKIMKGSALAKELLTLQWVVDQYGKRTENKAQNNHGCDASMYLRNALASLLPSANSGAPTATAAIRSEDDDPTPIAPEYGDADAMYPAEQW